MNKVLASYSQWLLLGMMMIEGIMQCAALKYLRYIYMKQPACMPSKLTKKSMKYYMHYRGRPHAILPMVGWAAWRKN